MTIPYPEKDTDALAPRPVDPYPTQPFVDLPVNSPIFPDNSEHAEIDITMLPGVPGQRGPRGYQGPPGSIVGSAVAPLYLDTVSRQVSIHEDELVIASTQVTGQIPASQISGLPDVTAFLYTQNSVSSNWSITHNLGFYPNVVVQDSAGTTVEGNVVYTDTNHLTIDFGYAITGTARLS